MNIETTNCAKSEGCSIENTLPYDIRIRNVPSESISPHWIVLADCLTTGVNDIWIILSQVWLPSNRKVLLHTQSDGFWKIISKSYNFIKNICLLHTKSLQPWLPKWPNTANSCWTLGWRFHCVLCTLWLEFNLRIQRLLAKWRMIFDTEWIL